MRQKTAAVKQSTPVVEWPQGYRPCGVCGRPFTLAHAAIFHRARYQAYMRLRGAFGFAIVGVLGHDDALPPLRKS